MPRSGTFVARAPTAIADALEKSPIVLPLIFYVVFAATVYVIQGPEPSLSIDHISYFKLADEIRANFPLGDYWRSFNSVRAYGVILAYLFGLTGSHITSLKVLLAVMTVMYLVAFQVFMRLATDSRGRAVMFSLLSALFVSFGASIWGMTDFAASLSRTSIVPFMVLMIWFFFREFSSPWRYAIFPGLILLSLLHLSALHVFLVFGAYEGLDFLFRRRCRIDRNLLYFALSLVASVAMQGVIENVGSGSVGFIRYTLNMTVPSIAQMLPAPAAPPTAPAAPAAEPSPPVAKPPASQAAPAPETPKPPEKLSNKEAWKIEILAFPWRNFPPSLATLATMASSFGIIFLLALTGAIRAFRRGVAKALDREMVMFTFAVLLCAYGLQIFLWALRDAIPVFPINFEEMRAINMLMIPSVYFIFRLYDEAPQFGGLSQRAVRVALIAAFVLQPIVIVKVLPAPWREAIIYEAVARGVLNGGDAPRMLYARQFLGLADEGRRFYYSSRPALEWLERNATPNDTVFTNLNEFYMSRVKTVGPFLEIVSLDVWDVRRAQWAQTLGAIDRALSARDLAQVMALARSLGATYAVVSWPVEDAAYRDDFYSVVKVPPVSH